VPQLPKLSLANPLHHAAPGAPRVFPAGNSPEGSAELSADEARLVAHHVAATAIRTAASVGSPLLDLFSEAQRQQVVSAMQDLVRALSARILGTQGRPHG
jgi:hypothetical protein